MTSPEATTFAIGMLVLAAALLVDGRWSLRRLQVLLRPPAGPEARGDAGAPTAESIVSLVAQAASLLRAGTSAHHVFRQLARVHEDEATAPLLAAIARNMELGEPGERAILGNRALFPPGHEPTFEALAAGWAVSERTGAPLADVLSRLAAALSDAADLARERTAAAAGPRASVRVLTVLPIIGLVLGMALGADLLAVTATPLGAASLLLGVVLLVAGHLWMRALARLREDA